MLAASSQPLATSTSLPKGVTLGHTVPSPADRLPSGNPALDRLLGGGFPRGRLSEVFGPRSSGRTSLAYGLLAATTRAGELAALVDCRDRFDPRFAEMAGVELSRVLWVRPRGEREALRAAEVLLATSGFAVVLLDLADGLSPFLATRFATAWTRLARQAAVGKVALVLLSRERLSGGAAALCLGIRDSRPLWPEHSLHRRVFAGIASRAEIVRRRDAAPESRSVELGS